MQRDTAVPLSTIADLASSRASGELICAGEGLEVHLYFQRGRVAWATDAARPLAFSRHLLERTRIDPDAYRELIDTCRREKRPLGETLVSWGLATLGDVREALGRQIDLAFELLSGASAVQTVFLSRPSQYESYDSALTFDVDDLLDHAKISAPAERITGIRLKTVPELARPSELVRLETILDGVLWAEVLDETSVVDASPNVLPSSRVPSRVLAQTLLGGSLLVAIPDGDETLAGVRLPSGESLWCRAQATVGAAIGALSAIAQLDVQVEPFVPPAGELWSTACDDESLTRTARELLGSCPEVHAAFITDGSGTLLGTGRWSVTAEEVAATLELRGGAFATDAASDASSSRRRLVSVEASYVLFASELSYRGRTAVAWLALDRACSKGLGWAYLASLSRQLDGLSQTQAA